MPQELSSIVEQIWRSGSSLAVAHRLSQELPSTSQQELLRKVESLAGMHLTEYSNTVFTEPAPSGPNNTSVDPNADLLARLLLLLVFGIYHSDSLLYLPPEMRQERLIDWAKVTNLDVDVVRRFATLGPAGLGVLVGKKVVS